MRIVEQSVELISITEDSQNLIARAGMICYNSTASDSGEFISKLMKAGHLSVIEFGQATFRIVTDRGVSHELVRHRLASYAQESTRYCNYSKERFGCSISVIKPSGMSDDATDIWRALCETSEEAYFELLKIGVKPQIARSVLPTCLATKLMMAMNFRSWLNFLSLRTSGQAHPEMRRLASKIGEILEAECPEVFRKRDILVKTRGE